VNSRFFVVHTSTVISRAGVRIHHRSSRYKKLPLWATRSDRRRRGWCRRDL